MMKSVVWTGVIVAAIGVIALVALVVPALGADTSTGLNGQPHARLQLWGVLMAASGLAVGSGLIGIGVGHWRHPQRRQTIHLGEHPGSREV